MLDFKPVKANPVLKNLGIHSDDYRFDFKAIAKELQTCEANGEIEKKNKIMRFMAEEDFFFFCYFVLDLPVNHPFLVARIYEVQEENNMTLDLWAREFWKSTLLTFALPIWELIHNPLERICIFSHTRAMAKSHMRKIKLELENNPKLPALWPHIFYENPKSEAFKWSENDGLYVKRKKNFGEASVEAWGLIEKLPAGKHFTIRIYDDIITETAVHTKGQREKVRDQFALSEALKASGKHKKRMIGTRYTHKDLYGDLAEMHWWKVRTYPAEVNEQGKAQVKGIPVYKPREELDEMLDTMGEYIYAAQMLQNPTSAGMQKFRRSWLKHWRKELPYLNYYLIVDPASTISTKADYTVMMIIGTDFLRNYWVVDIVRERMELGEKWERLRDLVLKYRPITVGYEKHHAESDMQYYDLKMDEEGVRFNIEPLTDWKSKGYRQDSGRIHKLIPLFQEGRIILPQTLTYTDNNGDFHDLVHDFIEEEYLLFPFSKHDDMLDDLSQILNPQMNIIFPNQKKQYYDEKEYDPLESDYNIETWMSY